MIVIVMGQVVNCYCRTIQDPSSQMLKWRAPPKTVLIIKKIYDDVVDDPFVQLASWLVQV